MLATQFYVEHNRPLRLAIDVSIWLFHIQAGQGGSNPALRTFYYRLLRLISLNIHPLFVFDGPNKPLFKRNKKVGGPGVRVATVPEFLAKQLLKQFGMPMHVAPGEAEAECAHLQQLGVVDAVLSDDVDTMMFGCSFTLRNWSTEGSSKSPSHVNVYKSQDILASSGIDRDGMILVALMSGGDYLPAGIPGCGPKISVDAAKAGFAKELCSLCTTDGFGYSQWRDRLQEELSTNASKFFSRRNTTLQLPSDFPNKEVLGYYTSPCVSSMERVNQLRQSMAWTDRCDFQALREFAAEAFDWRNLGGAKKFIRNLAPAVLVRELRLSLDRTSNQNVHEVARGGLICAVHGQRQHFSVDNQVEMRVSYTPAYLVPIDLSAEPDDDLVDNEAPISSQQMTLDDFALEQECLGVSDDDDVPATPSRRKRKVRPFDPSEPAKIWLLRDWIQLSHPAMLEDYEAERRQAHLRIEQQQLRRLAKDAGTKRVTKKSRPQGQSQFDRMGVSANALIRHVVTTKPGLDRDLETSIEDQIRGKDSDVTSIPTTNNRSDFVLSSTQVSEGLAALQQNKTATAPRKASVVPQTPRRKKQVAVVSLDTPSPRAGIAHYFTPSKPREQTSQQPGVVDLTTSSPVQKPSKDCSVQVDGVFNPDTFEVIAQEHPNQRARRNLQTSSSIPPIVSEQMITTSTPPPTSSVDLYGSKIMPIEVSPALSSRHETVQDSLLHAVGQATVAKDRLLTGIHTVPNHNYGHTLAKPQDSDVLSAGRQSQRRVRSKIFGHRVSQVDFLDLT